MVALNMVGAVQSSGGNGVASTRKRTADQVRQALEAAMDRIGSPTTIGHLCDVTEGAVRGWRRRGSLDGVPAESADKFAKAAKEPLDHFLVDEG